MAITLVHADTEAVNVTTGTTLSVPIDASATTGDMIVIPYFCRSASTPPSGFTAYGEAETDDGIGGRQGFHYKISDGTEGGTSVTLTQASSNRMEAFCAIFRGSSALSVSKNTSVDADSSADATLPTLTESTAFLALAVAHNGFTGTQTTPIFDIGAAADVEWARLNTECGPTNASGRVWGFYGLYSSADTTTLEIDNVYGSTKDWGASMITVLEGAADTTAPTLSSASGTQTGSTTADLSVSTDEGNGTLYWVVTTSATSPSVAQVQAGQDHTGSAAADSGSQSVSGTGTQSPSATGLTASTAYYAHFQHADAAANDSTVATSASFTTAAPAATKGVRVTLYDGATAQASITGITAMWWDSSPPTGSPVFTTASASTDGSGVLELDLDADTSLAVAANGHLKVYKLDGTDEKDSIAWQGRLAIQDIS